jgi:tRNA-Thr(GGU) m(6)t(6)A37 methyltransferase TsaA
MKFEISAIGAVKADGACEVRVAPAFRKGLQGLGEFSHAWVLWVPNKMPAWDARGLSLEKPYAKGPKRLGVFATRSPYRPNPLCASVGRILGIDAGKGIISLDWIDAEDGSPVLDIKPYHPSSDRARDAATPKWCAHWPKCLEDSGAFPWQEEIPHGP